MVKKNETGGSENEAPARKEEDSKEGEFADTFAIPEDAIDSGSDGVRWYLDKMNILNFEAGVLNRTDRWRQHAGSISGIKVIPNRGYDKLILPEDCASLFEGTSAGFIEAEKFDTGSAVNMSCMFRNNPRLEKLDLSHFDTGSVTDMSGMFTDCKNLATVYLSSFNTSRVTSLEFMFYNCKSLWELNFSTFDTGSVESAKNMLFGTNSLQIIKFSKKFFKGNMTEVSTPFFETTNWFPVLDSEAVKTWREMAESWTDADAGYWHIVYNIARLSFDSNGGTEIPDEILQKGITDLSGYVPSKPGCTFTGWYTDPECTSPAGDSFRLILNTTLYAGWN